MADGDADGPKPVGDICDFGGNGDTAGGTEKGDSKNKESGSDAKPAPEGYRYCTTCDAGPWEVGNNEAGRRIVDYHVGLGHDVVECNERGVVKE